jgi:hypothetical protein
MSYRWARNCIAWYLNEPKSLKNATMDDLRKQGYADKNALELVINSPLLKEPDSQMLFFYKLDDVFDPGVQKIRGRVNRNNRKGTNYLGNFPLLIDAYKAAITKGYNNFYYYPNSEVYGFNSVEIGKCWTEKVQTRRGIGPFFNSFENVEKCPNRVAVYKINPWPLIMICNRIWHGKRAQEAYLALEGFENKNEVNKVNNNLLIMILLIIFIIIIFIISKLKNK